MKLYHLLFTDKDGNFRNETMKFNSFEDAENYLKRIGAVYWEIGV